MSYLTMLNKLCSWTRKSTYTVGTYGEQAVTTVTIAHHIKCRYEPVTGKELEEIGLVGELDKSYERFFINGITDIQVSDEISINGVSDDYVRKVKWVGDAAGHGHHIEAIVEKLKIK